MDPLGYKNRPVGYENSTLFIYRVSSYRDLSDHF
jgi:hypothetical protein